MPQPFQPKLHLTDADFHSITRNGELCDEDGGLGAQEFELVLREQVYRIVCNFSSMCTDSLLIPYDSPKRYLILLCHPVIMAA